MSRECTFRFKKFRVINDKTAMKVGTDGVLLGAWCDVSAATSVLDVGAGCGLIALMIAQRNDHAMIDAIDIDCCAVEEAYINFHDSPWGGRLNVREADFNIFANSCVKKYDLIVSNPPFFSNGVMPAGVSRERARHSSTLTMRQLLENSAKILAKSGKIAMITPADIHEEIVELCNVLKLYINKITDVIPVIGAAPKRILWEISHTQDALQQDSLTIEVAPLVYTDAYKTLCKDFYLKF